MDYSATYSSLSPDIVVEFFRGGFKIVFFFLHLEKISLSPPWTKWKKGTNCRIGEMGVVWDENWPITRPVASEHTVSLYRRRTHNYRHLKSKSSQQRTVFWLFLFSSPSICSSSSLIYCFPTAKCVCVEISSAKPSPGKLSVQSLSSTKHKPTYRQEEDEDQKNLGGEKKGRRRPAVVTTHTAGEDEAQNAIVMGRIF